LFNEKVILITGGTGSFGHYFTNYIFSNYKPEKLIIFSRDEFKQYEMAKIFPTSKHPIRFFLGDIRDKDRLKMALDEVDYVIHAAALKQVPALEYNPFEAVKTNILGTQNLTETALEKNVKVVIALSTDKAVNPVNLYGATKMTMEKLVTAANAYVGKRITKFACVRYGNVVGSRGSVLEYFLSLKNKGILEFPVTDIKMTRFWINLDSAINLVATAIQKCTGGEIFVPKIPSMKILDIINAISDKSSFKIIGIRPGEKINETLIHEEESRNCYDLIDYYVIMPQFGFESKNFQYYKEHKKVPEGFIYKSNTNSCWLNVEEMKKLIKNTNIKDYKDGNDDFI